MKNLTKEQKAEIIKQHFKELKSQNEIVENTGINKRYVNEVCQAYAALKGLMGLDESEATPQVTLFPKPSSFKPAQRIDHTTPVQTPQQNNWGYPGSNTYELEYKDRRIKDLEQDKSDLRRKLEQTENDLSAKTRELQILQLDYNTIEKKHDFEIKLLEKMKELDQKPSFTDKILSNDSLVKGLAGLAITKMGSPEMAASLMGTPMPQQEVQQQVEIPTHPLTLNTEYSQTLNIIYQVIASMPAKHLEALLQVLSILLGMPDSIENTLTALKAKVERMKNQPTNNQA
jgi:hypothetical protein